MFRAVPRRYAQAVVLRFSHYRRVLGRGMRRRCPQCGQAGLFVRWHTLRSHCPVCALDFRGYDQDTWAFMYLSTTFLTGVIVVGMLLFPPDNRWLGRAVVVVAAIAVILGTLPLRKSLGMAVEYLIDLRLDHRQDLCLREQRD